MLQIEPAATVYSPNFSAHDSTAASSAQGTPWTPVSQSGVTGSGTPADPFTVTTTVGAAATNMQVRETYSYVTGSRAYTFRITVINNNGALRNVDLYHAADCYLAGSDFGYGFFDSSNGGVFCTENPNNSPAGRVLGFAPGSTPARYIESFYNTVWDRTDGTDYPNTVQADTFQDNGVGLQWKLIVPANGSTTVEGVSLHRQQEAPGAMHIAVQGEGQEGKKNTFTVQATANGETDSTPAAQQWKVKKKKKKG